MGTTEAFAAYAVSLLPLVLDRRCNKLTSAPSQTLCNHIRSLFLRSHGCCSHRSPMALRRYSVSFLVAASSRAFTARYTRTNDGSLLRASTRILVCRYRTIDACGRYIRGLVLPDAVASLGTSPQFTGSTRISACLWYHRCYDRYSNRYVRRTPTRR